MPSSGIELLGNNELMVPGATTPSNEGPRTIPATISAMTIGCASLAVNTPIKRERAMMVAACAMKMARGL